MKMVKIHKAKGVHILLNMRKCNKYKLNDVQKLITYLKEASISAGSTPSGYRFKKFQPQGCSVIYLLDESHISIHTYPEHSTAFVDIFTCGESANPHLACDYLIDKLEAGYFTKKAIIRV